MSKYNPCAPTSPALSLGPWAPRGAGSAQWHARSPAWLQEDAQGAGSGPHAPHRPHNHPTTAASSSSGERRQSCRPHGDTGATVGGEARGWGAGVLLGWGLPPGLGTSRSRRGARRVCRWVHLPLGASCFWTHRPRPSSWKGCRQGPQAPEPGGQNSRRCRAQSRLRGHDAAAGTGEHRSGGGAGPSAPPAPSVAAWRGTQLPWAAPAAANGADVPHRSCPSALLCRRKATTDCN